MITPSLLKPCFLREGSIIRSEIVPEERMRAIILLMAVLIMGNYDQATLGIWGRGHGISAAVAADMRVLKDGADDGKRLIGLDNELAVDGARASAAGRHKHWTHHEAELATRAYVAWIDRVGAASTSAAGAEDLEMGVLRASEYGRYQYAKAGANAGVVSVDARDGAAQFSTVQAAVDSVPKGNTQRVTILIAAGTYREKVKVPKNKPFITFAGAGMQLTKITWDDTANSSHSTFKSATVSVMAPYFTARNLAFENTAPAPLPGEAGAQAVALQISGDASAFYGCAFFGAQDTLYDHKGRHFFVNCWIQGSIDFIFGDGRSVYKGCVLYTIPTTAGALTAQKRKLATEDTGFSFIDCNVTGSGVVYLGRAWGAYSRVVFIHTYLDSIILPEGWYDWGIPSREKSAFYGEYNCFGPGANLQNRVAWSHELTLAQARPFMSLGFINGGSWITSS